jgi:hypothetical protein
MIKLFVIIILFDLSSFFVQELSFLLCWIIDFSFITLNEAVTISF